MLRDGAFSLAPVVLKEVATSPYYHVDDAVAPPVVEPPRRGGGGGPWIRVRRRRRLPFEYKKVGSGGVAVGGWAEITGVDGSDISTPPPPPLTPEELRTRDEMNTWLLLFSDL